MSDCTNQHTITLILENEPGILFRVAGLFSARGYNIDSLSVEKTADQARSCMKIVTHGSDALLQQIINQLNKLVGIVRIESSTSEV